MVYNIHVITKPSHSMKKTRHFQDGTGGSIYTKIGTTFNVKDIALTLFLRRKHWPSRNRPAKRISYHDKMSLPLFSVWAASPFDNP